MLRLRAVLQSVPEVSVGNVGLASNLITAFVSTWWYTMSGAEKSYNFSLIALAGVSADLLLEAACESLLALVALHNSEAIQDAALSRLSFLDIRCFRKRGCLSGNTKGQGSKSDELHG